MINLRFVSVFSISLVHPKFVDPEPWESLGNLFPPLFPVRFRLLSNSSINMFSFVIKFLQNRVPGTSIKFWESAVGKDVVLALWEFRI